MEIKNIISSKQAILILFFASMAETVFHIYGDVINIANQDSWIAIIIGVSLTGLLVIYPLVNLGIKYPDKTMIQYSEDIMGKILGKLFGIMFIYYMFQLHCWGLRTFGDVISEFFNSKTMVGFYIMISICTIYLVSNGVEVIARFTQFIASIFIFSLIMLILFSGSNSNLKNILPIMQVNILSLLKASIPVLSWYSVGFVFGMFTPFIKNKTNLKKTVIIVIIFSGVLLAIISILLISVFSVSLLQKISFPLLLLVRNIKIRIEILFMIIWMIAMFVRINICSYATVLSLSQLFNLDDYQYFIVVENILALAYAMYQYNSQLEMFYLFSVAHLYYLIFSLGLPLILWIVSFFRS